MVVLRVETLERRYKGLDCDRTFENMLPLLVVVTLLASTGLITGVGADPNYLYHVCPNTTTFAQNSTYQSNLTTLLSALSSNATRLNSRAAASSSGDVHGQFLCRGDVNATVCRDCVEFAVKDAVERCPVEQEMVIWYDECQLRYSNRSFLGAVAERPRVSLLNTGDVTEPDQDRFNRLLNKTMKEAAGVAAEAEKRFATVEEDFSGFQTLYTLAQCTPDLSRGNCSACLTDATGRLPICCAGKLGGRVLFPSCNVRYEFYPFYELPISPISPSTPPNPATSPPTSPIKEESKIQSKTIAAIAVPIAVCLVMFIVGLCFVCKRVKRKHNVVTSKNVEGNDISTAESLQFNFATVEAATNKFSADNKLGEGGFGEVYKGSLPNGQLIAVKRLSKGSGQGAAEFKNEVVTLANLEHRNLVRLLGFCLEGEEKLLIYEYVPNKSLDYFLYDPERSGELDWSRRYNIIGGVARGILYLHEDSQLRIIHRDLKASNVLLDGDMKAKISDFGMAKMFEVDQTRGNTSRIVGTYGYMAPEYAMQGQFSVKSDVYSFGVLILEIISGKKNTSFYESGYAEDLLSYAWKLWNEGTSLKLLDPVLVDSYSEDEVMRCINVGLLCVQEDPEDRPTMKTIVLMFNSDSVTLGVPEKPAFYNRTEGDMEAFDQSTTTGNPQLSVNEASISELYPR